jgi:agmatinase
MTATEPSTEPSTESGTAAEAALLVVNPDLVIVGADSDAEGNGDGEGSVVWHAKQSWRVTLGAATARLWLAFAVPRTVASVVAALGGGRGGDPRARERLTASVATLLDRGLLVHHAPDGTMLTTGRGGMFNAPVLSLADALRGESANVVFVGMPYDVGATHRPGSRFAPTYLRRASGALFHYRDTPDGPPGMYDPVSGRWLLRGTRLADAGDISQIVHTRNGPSFDALAELIASCAAAGRTPVVLGGDHSITLPLVNGLTSHHEALGVVHIDAHSDYAEPRTGEDWRTACHHGNVMNWVVGNERVHRIAQFGIRQLENPRSRPSDKRVVWPGTSACEAEPERVLGDLPADLAYHVTIDIDGLDPAVLPGTGTPLPGGFALRQLTSLLELICRNRRVVGIDLVEVLPGASDVDGLIASDVLLRTLAAAVEPEPRP